MPQAHNRGMEQQGTGVRFLSSISLSGTGMKSVRMKNSVERNLQEIHSRRLERLVLNSNRKGLRMRLKLSDSLRRMAAYKKVVEHRAMKRAAYYDESLDWNYTEAGMKSDIDKVLHDMDPVTIRRHRETDVIKLNRERYANILQKSKMVLTNILNFKGEETGEEVHRDTALVNGNSRKDLLAHMRRPRAVVTRDMLMFERPSIKLSPLYQAVPEQTQVENTRRDQSHIKHKVYLDQSGKWSSKKANRRSKYVLPPLKITNITGPI